MNELAVGDYSLATEDLFVTRNWYVAGWSGDLSGAPLERRICGRRLAFFRDSTGQAHAIDAACPHRGANLSRGQVCGNSLRCPFHGLEFSGDGACVRIPSQEAGEPIPEALRVNSYPVREAGGLLWIWPDAAVEPVFEPKVPDFLTLASPWRLQSVPATECTGSYLNSLENALDDSHLAFVHSSTIPGAPKGVPEFEICIAPDKRSYYCEVALDPDAPPDSTPAAEVATGHWLMDMLSRIFMESLQPIRKRFDYDLSGMVCVTMESLGERADYSFAFFTPIAADSTLLTGGVVRNHSLNPVADRLFARYMPALIAEDVGAMDLLVPEARGPGGLPRPRVVKADRNSLQFRRIYGDALRAEGKAVPWSSGRGGDER